MTNDAHSQGDFKMVPIEPTQAMVDAALRQPREAADDQLNESAEQIALIIYREMVAAAPGAPLPQGDSDDFDRFYAATEALIQLGRESAVAITGDIEDSADVDTPEKAVAAIREEICLGREAARAQSVQDPAPLTSMYGQPCAACGAPVRVPMSRNEKAAAVIGDRIWHGQCFPADGVASFTTNPNPSDRSQGSATPVQGVVPSGDPEFPLALEERLTPADAADILEGVARGEVFITPPVAWEAARLLRAESGGGHSEHHGLDNDRKVFFYERDFYVLSNFSAFTLEWKGVRFDTSEAAYHWEKFQGTGNDGIALGIRNAPSAHVAFKYAEEMRRYRRPDWDAVKVDIMRDILRAKADQHEYVRRKLLATGNRELIEDSWRDDFWGWGPNRDGQNMLGKLWMEVRAELRQREAA